MVNQFEKVISRQEVVFAILYFIAPTTEGIITKIVEKQIII